MHAVADLLDDLGNGWRAMMKVIKCKCGSEKMRVEKRETCDKCEYNPCCHCQQDTCSIEGVFCRGYDHGCKDYESRVDVDGECDVDTCHGEGCLIFKCSECGKIVDNCAFYGG